MQVIAGPIIIFFIVFNIVIYHKIFRVIYFDFVKGFGQILIGAIFVACIETAIVISIGGYVLMGIGIIVGIVLIVKGIKKAKGVIDSRETPEPNSSVNAEAVEEPMSEFNPNLIVTPKTQGKTDSITPMVDERIETVPVGEAMKYIKNHYDTSTKVMAIKKFREMTGLGLAEAKDIVDQILVNPVPDRVVETPKTTKDERMFCPYCGKKILRTSKFCNYCGQGNSYKG